MDIRSNLMTYKQLHNRSRDGSFYEYKLENDGIKLYYFGSKHLFEYEGNEEVIEKLKNFWKEFVESTTGKRKVFIEGTAENPVPDTSGLSEKEVVEKIGEGGLITELARKKGIQVASPEPSPEEYSNKLADKFSKQQIIYYYVIRSLSYLHKKEDKHLENEDEFLERQLERWRKVTRWSDVDFTKKLLTTIHKQNFSGEFDPNDRTFFDAIRRPGWNTTITNKIAKETSKQRDTGVIENIVNEIREGTNVFVVFGLSHAVMQEPALRSLLGKK